MLSERAMIFNKKDGTLRKPKPGDDICRDGDVLVFNDSDDVSGGAEVKVMDVLGSDKLLSQPGPRYPVATPEAIADYTRLETARAMRDEYLRDAWKNAGVKDAT